MNTPSLETFDEQFNRLPTVYTYKVKYITDLLRRSMMNKQGYSLLDVGCGTGVLFTIPVAVRFLSLKNITFHGIDIDKPSIELANQYIKKINLKNISFSSDSCEALTGSYDFICCIEVLEHLKDPSIMLGQIKRLLKPNGKFVITIPNKYGPFELERALYQFLKHYKIIKILTSMDYLIKGIRKIIKYILSIFITSLRNDQLPIKDKHNAVFKIRGTLNEECPHVQFFKLNEIKHLLEIRSFRIKAVENSVFLYGPITRYFFSNFRFLKKVNDWFRDKINHKFASGWIIVAEKK